MQNGRISDIRRATGTRILPVNDSHARNQYTVDSLFAYAERVMNDAKSDLLLVRYDAELGFPYSIVAHAGQPHHEGRDELHVLQFTRLIPQRTRPVEDRDTSAAAPD